jgi:stage V sporulation protein AE
MDYVIAFLVGGVICALTQILMEKTKMMPGRIMVLLVCLGALLGAVGLYEPFAEWAKAGATVPLIGFGNNLWKGVKEMVDEKGFLGIFLGGFKNCALGLSAALIFSYIASLLCQPKMKKQ